MNFEKNDFYINIGKRLGFVLSFFIMTIIWYLILRLTNHLPKDWSYFNIFLVVLLITILGIGLKYFLKD
jgi:hypothetical protein